jgi:tetratricopeptide (TPR) repeat protein
MADSYGLLGDVQWRLAKMEDAEASFQKAMEIFDQRAAEIAADPVYNVNLGTAFNSAKLAYFLVSTGREDDAAKFARKAADAARHVTEPPADLVIALSSIAFVQRRLGDDTGYRANCKALIDVPVAGTDDITKARTILTWCLAPNSIEDLDLLVKRAEQFALDNSLGHRHFGLFLLGGALYRDGQFDRAAKELEESIAAYPSHPPYDLITRNFQRLSVETINSQRLLLAMTRWQQGRRDEARQLLAEALPAVDTEIQNPSTWIFIRAIAEIFRREAVGLIEPKESDEAVESKSQINDE